MSAAYTFPLYGSEMLANMLDECFGTQLNYATILKNPCWDNLQPLWEKIVEVMLGVKRDNLKPPSMHACHVFTNQEVYDDHVYYRALFFKTRKLVLMSKFSDFTLNDLTRPDPARLRLILSALMNFCMYVLEKRRVYQTSQLGVQAAAEHVTRAAGRRVEKAIIVEDLLAEEASHRPEADKLLAEARECERRAKENMKAAQAEKEKLEALQQCYNDLVQQAQQRKGRIQDCRARKEELKSMLVPESPSKVQASVDQLGLDLAAMEQRIQTIQQDQKRTQQQLQNGITVTDRLRHAVTKLEDVHSKLVQKKQASRAVKELKRQAQALHNETVTMQFTVDGLQRQLSEAKGKLHKLTTEAKAEIEMARQESESMKGAKDVAARRVRTRQAKIAEIDKQVAALQDQMRDVQARCDSELGQVFAAVDAAHKDMQSYKSALEGVLSSESRYAHQSSTPSNRALADMTNVLEHTSITELGKTSLAEG